MGFLKNVRQFCPVVWSVIANINIFMVEMVDKIFLLDIYIASKKISTWNGF